jgi:hypothetical protein
VLFTDDFPDSGDGPTIVPGSYTVVLQYGSQTLRSPVTVQLDPRLHPTAADLAARLALEIQIRDAIDRLDRAVAAAMAQHKDVSNLIQLDVHSSEGDLLHETKVREQLGFLLNSLEGAFQRPTAAEYQTFADLNALATAGEARLQTVAAK